MTLLPDLQARLDDAAARHGVPGAVIAVGLGDDLAEAATGVVNRNTGVPATVDTVFQIGSVTKVWTSALVLQLADEGLIDIDTPVRKYLPEFGVADPQATGSVTVRQLLSHTAGFDGDLFEDTGRGDDSLDRYVAFLHGAGQVHPPGALFSYCNSGFSVLGRLVARLRGGTWERAMHGRLIGPLGATHMATLAEEAILFRAAVGHIRVPDSDEPVVCPMWGFPRSIGPAGAITCAAPRDLVRFGRMLLAGGVSADGTRLLSAESAAAMRQPQVAVPGVPGPRPGRWGLGVALFDWGGATVFGHDGDTPGQSTFWRVIPEHGFVVAMSVTGPGGAGLVADVLLPVLREATGVPAPDLATPPAEPPPLGDPAAYLGRYAGPLRGYEVAAAPDGLDVTLIPSELAAGWGMRRRTDRYVRLSGETFIAAEPEDGYHEMVTFIHNGRYLHNGRAVPRVE
jgi:CubicO group peptidase (beta-lactamase class C family)